MPITYLKGDLFNHSNLHEYIIVHACNAQGVWGSGFAKQCKEKYPLLHKQYEAICNKDTLGKCIFLTDIKCQMLALITSENYGNKVDTPEMILENTKKSLDYYFNGIHFLGDKYISPKFNSGLFKVPWEETEKILKEFVDKHSLEWIVYENE